MISVKLRDTWRNLAKLAELSLLTLRFCLVTNLESCGFLKGSRSNRRANANRESLTTSSWSSSRRGMVLLARFWSRSGLRMLSAKLAWPPLFYSPGHKPIPSSETNEFMEQSFARRVFSWHGWHSWLAALPIFLSIGRTVYKLSRLAFACFYINP